MSNDERRSLAWRRLWAEKWFGRLFGGGILLGLCAYVVQGTVGAVLGILNVTSWFDYAQIVLRNRSDLTTPVPGLTGSFVSQATSSTVLILFFTWLMSGIAAYGSAVILLKCIRNDDRNWLAEAFGGFTAPFGMLWLFIRRQLINFGWSLVALLPFGVVLGFILPCMTTAAAAEDVFRVLACSAVLSVACALALVVLCIPFYRYRYLWLVKAEHPDWSAGRCLDACRKLTKGNMLRSFRFDCSYWKPIAALLLLAGAVVLCAALAAVSPMKGLFGFLSFVGLVVGVACAIVLAQYVNVGQGSLYRELKENHAHTAV